MDCAKTCKSTMQILIYAYCGLANVDLVGEVNIYFFVLTNLNYNLFHKKLVVENTPAFLLAPIKAPVKSLACQDIWMNRLVYSAISLVYYLTQLIYSIQNQFTRSVSKLTHTVVGVINYSVLLYKVQRTNVLFSIII